MQRTMEEGRSSRAQARRQRVIAVARKLFAQHGFHGTGVAHLAALAEIHIGQLYRDFAGKEAIISAIVDEDINDLLATPIADNGARGDELLAQLMRWVLDLYIRIIAPDKPRLYLEIVAEASRNPAIATIVQVGDVRIRNAFLTALHAYDDGRRGASEEEVIADVFMSFIIGLGGRSVHQPDVDGVRLAHRAGRIIEREIRDVGQAKP